MKGKPTEAVVNHSFMGESFENREKEVDTIVIEVKEVYNTTYILTKHYSNFTPLLR